MLLILTVSPGLLFHNLCSGTPASGSRVAFSGQACPYSGVKFQALGTQRWGAGGKFLYLVLETFIKKGRGSSSDLFLWSTMTIQQ